MNGKSLVNFTPIVVILAGLVYTEYTLFQMLGLGISAAIESSSDVEAIELIFFLTTLIALLLAILVFILIMLTVLKEDLTDLVEKITALLTIIIALLFGFQIIAGFMMMITG